MSMISCVWNYARAHPPALYLGGALVLGLGRSYFVTEFYRQHFKKWDVQRHLEWKAFTKGKELPKFDDI